MTSNIDRTNAMMQEPLLYNDEPSDEPRDDQTCEREGPGVATIGAAIGGSAVGAIAGTLIAGPIGTAIGATLGGVGGAMLSQANEAGDDLDTPDNDGPFDNPAKYDQTAAEVGKERSILVGDDPGYDAAATTLGTEERAPASRVAFEEDPESVDDLH